MLPSKGSSAWRTRSEPAERGRRENRRAGSGPGADRRLPGTGPLDDDALGVPNLRVR